MRAAETAMRPHGLTSVQWAPLMIISRGGNPTAAKPLSIAFEEISADKIVLTDAPTEPEQALDLPEGDADLAADSDS
jgi:hypothetical protein